MVTSPYEWKILVADDKHQGNKQKTKYIQLSFMLSFLVFNGQVVLYLQ